MLVRTPNWLGDGIMAGESIAGIIRKHPDTHLWCHPRVEGLFRFLFPRTPLITLGEHLPKQRFEKLLLLTSSFRSAFLGLKAGIPERIGFKAEKRSFILTHAVEPEKGRLRHHSLDYEILADAVGCRAEPLNLPHARKPGNHLAVFPGARYGAAKQWRGFPECAALLGMNAVFYGTATERELLRTIADRSGGGVEAGLAFPELAERLSEASVCIGNDSGGVHLAALLGVPTVAVFCSTSPEWTGPRGKRVVSLESGSDCSPCFRRTCTNGSYACVEGISPEDVVRAVRIV